MIRCVFRCDAGPNIGGGHVMRCLALARELSPLGLDIAFCSSPQTLDYVSDLDLSSFEWVHPDADNQVCLPEHWQGHCDVLIFDGYGFSDRDHQSSRHLTDLLVVIDDQANRQLDCDILIDPTPGRTPDDYQVLAPDDCERLTGADFALLRSEFAGLRDRSIKRRHGQSLRTILVSFGMTDPDGLTAEVTRLVHDHVPGTQINVVLWPGAESLPVIEDLVSASDRVRLRLAEAHMAQRMLDADLAIGAGGGTALERCVLGLASIIMVIADNQAGQADYLHKAGAALQLGLDDHWKDGLIAHIKRLQNNPDQLSAMSNQALTVCDGRGCHRAAHKILERINSIRGR